MNILLFLIPLSLLLLVAAGWAFVWAVKRGQFEDLDTPAIDILRNDLHEQPQTTAGADAGVGADAVNRAIADKTEACDDKARDDHAD